MLLIILLLLGSMGTLLLLMLSNRSEYDRVLLVNSFGGNTIALISVLSCLDRVNDLLDIALLYACVSFITTIALLRFFVRGSSAK